MNFDEDMKIKNRVSNELKQIDIKHTNRLFRVKDKSDRRTTEHCIDPRVLRIIDKLKKNKYLSEFDGCLSTGKEANVYYGKGKPIEFEEEKELALKIYKTSILVFKDRERYINGEFRFRHGYCKGNPRKMVAIWAEKEVRNLKRIGMSGIPVPKPYILKSNVIVMEFIGKDGEAAPRLRDALEAFESVEDFDKVYIEVLDIMRKMYRLCKLVHSDFSEYNLLYYDNKVYVIDVAQAVENDHPNAMNFLKRDCKNINEFFEKNGIDTLTDKQVFDYVSKLDIKDKDRLQYIKDMKCENETSKENDPLFKAKENDLFGNFEIPRTLMDEDVDKIAGNADVKTALTNICGIVKPKEREEDFLQEKLPDDSEDDKEEEENDIEEKADDNEEGKEGELKENQDKTDEDGEEVKKEKKPKVDPFEGMSKKERKIKVKEENRERRENKKSREMERHRIHRRKVNKL